MMILQLVFTDLQKKGDPYDLVWHEPQEFSNIFCIFIEKPKNKILAEVTRGKRL